MSNSSLPISHADPARVLSFCDHSDPFQCDVARLLVLLVTPGLRPSEAAQLQRLHSIFWDGSTLVLRLPCAKNGKPRLVICFVGTDVLSRRSLWLDPIVGWLD